MSMIGIQAFAPRLPLLQRCRRLFTFFTLSRRGGKYYYTSRLYTNQILRTRWQNLNAPNAARAEGATAKELSVLQNASIPSVQLRETV